jgi:hypothetical protein
VWCGVWCVVRGVVWYGVVRVWSGVVICGVAWCDVVWCGVVRCGVVWCGMASSGVVWGGLVWCVACVVWCVVRGSWCVECGVWCVACVALGLGAWSVVCGMWSGARGRGKWGGGVWPWAVCVCGGVAWRCAGRVAWWWRGGAVAWWYGGVVSRWCAWCGVVAWWRGGVVAWRVARGVRCAARGACCVVEKLAKGCITKLLHSLSPIPGPPQRGITWRQSPCAHLPPTNTTDSGLRRAQESTLPESLTHYGNSYAMHPALGASTSCYHALGARCQICSRNWTRLLRAQHPAVVAQSRPQRREHPRAVDGADLLHTSKELHAPSAEIAIRGRAAPRSVTRAREDNATSARRRDGGIASKDFGANKGTRAEATFPRHRTYQEHRRGGPNLVISPL